MKKTDDVVLVLNYVNCSFLYRLFVLIIHLWLDYFKCINLRGHIVPSRWVFALMKNSRYRCGTKIIDVDNIGVILSTSRNG